MTEQINESMKEKRDALVAEYNKIPKTPGHDARRKAAFERLMKFEEGLING